MPAAGRPRLSSAHFIGVVILLVAGAILGAACSSGSEPDRRPGTVVVRDMPGQDDSVSFYFAEPPPTDAKRRVEDAAAAAGLPNNGIEDDTDEGLHRFRLSTTVGERTGFLDRRIDARIFQALVQSGAGDVLLALPFPMTAPPNARPLSSDLGLNLYRLEEPTDATYRVRLSRFLLMLLILPAVALVPYGVLRIYAARLEHSTLNETEKVHRIRRTLMGFSLLIPLAFFPIALATGLWFFPDLVLSEIFPAGTRWAGGPLLISMFLLVPVAAGMLGAYRAVRPVYRKIRRVGRSRWSVRRKIAVGLVLFLPQILWLILVSVLSDGLVVVMILWFPFFLGFVAFFPALLAWVALRGRPDPEVHRRLVEFCRRRGVRVRDVVVVEGQSERVANALVAGIIPGFIYVFVTDHLLERFTQDEVEAVLAHEIGHAKQHHVLIKLGAVIGILVLWSLLMSGVFVLLDVSPALIAMVTPLAMAVGILLAHGRVGIVLERRADDYAAKTVGIEPTIHALEKLAEVNMVKRRTGPVWNMLTQHPGIEQRIERLQSSRSKRAA